MPHFAQHFEVVFGALFQPVPLHHFLRAVEVLQSGVQLVLDALEGDFEPLRTGHEELLWVNPRLFQFVKHLPTDRIAHGHGDDTVEIEADAQRVVAARHPNVEDFAAQPGLAPFKVGVGARVLQPDEGLHQVLRFDGLTHVHPEVVLKESFGRVQPVNARDGGDDNAIWT